VDYSQKCLIVDSLALTSPLFRLLIELPYAHQSPLFVIPAKAGIQKRTFRHNAPLLFAAILAGDNALDSGFRRNDGSFSAFARTMRGGDWCA
jgi:hypothetical protein